MVYEVLRPLYGIPSSARALHRTLSKWFKEQGFKTAGYEDSVWVCPAGGAYAHDMIVSAHIDDTLIASSSLATMTKFKQAFLTRFEGTDEGPVTTYLGCELVRDRAVRKITFRQAVYAEKVLKISGAWSACLVTTPLEQGMCLTADDSPAFVDPDLHRQYRGITGHRDLAFAYAELSKFVQSPLPRSPPRGRAGSCVPSWYVHGWPGLQRPRAGAQECARRVGGFRLPDTRKSVTGDVLSMNNGPISWKA